MSSCLFPFAAAVLAVPIRWCRSGARRLWPSRFGVLGPAVPLRLSRSVVRGPGVAVCGSRPGGLGPVVAGCGSRAGAGLVRRCRSGGCGLWFAARRSRSGRCGLRLAGRCRAGSAVPLWSWRAVVRGSVVAFRSLQVAAGKPVWGWFGRCGLRVAGCGLRLAGRCGAGLVVAVCGSRSGGRGPVVAGCGSQAGVGPVWWLRSVVRGPGIVFRSLRAAARKPVSGRIGGGGLSVADWSVRFGRCGLVRLQHVHRIGRLSPAQPPAGPAGGRRGGRAGRGPSGPVPRPPQVTCGDAGPAGPGPCTADSKVKIL